VCGHPSYLVLVAGFFFAPQPGANVEQGQLTVDRQTSMLTAEVPLIESIKFLVWSLWLTNHYCVKLIQIALMSLIKIVSIVVRSHLIPTDK